MYCIVLYSCLFKVGILNSHGLLKEILLRGKGKCYYSEKGPVGKRQRRERERERERERKRKEKKKEKSKERKKGKTNYNIR